MKFDWYRLINRQTFLDSGLPSVSMKLNLEGFGLKTVLVTSGNFVGVTVDDVFLPVDLNSKNPFRIGERAVFVDSNDDIWYGVFTDED